jgi:hypothetical protein
MARAYSVSGPSVTGTTNRTAVTIISATTVRPRVYEFSVAVQTDPNTTDQQLRWAVQRFTAVGTAGSNPTPLPVDPGDVASLTTAGITHSAEPTYTATGVLFGMAMNQRAVFRWVAVPGQELLAPATASNGIGLQNVAITATAIINGNIQFME